MKTIKFLFLFLILSSSVTVMASHMMGAEVTYKWLSGKKYQITSKIYRDCRGIPMTNPTFTAFSPNCSSPITMSFTRTTIEDITVRCSDTIAKPCNPSNTTVGTAGVELHTYMDTIDFATSPYNSFINNNCCEVYFSVEQCCRNGAITVLNAGNLYVDAMLNICNSNLKNTSPQFKSYNVLNASCNLAFSQNFGSKDYVDYDSLAYDLVNPLNAFNSPESYSGSFSSAIPMTPYCNPPGVLNCTPSPNSKPPKGFYFNKLTGDVVFTPTNCSEVGVMALKITEFRKDSSNSKWLPVGYVIRDIQIVVVKSGDNYIPKATFSTTYNFTTRNKQCIDIKTFDTLSGSAYNPANKGDVTYLSIKEIPDGATFGYVDSSAKNKTGRFCWTIHDSVYLKYKNKNKLLPISFEVRDNFCDYPAVVQKSFSIKILPPDSSGFLSINSFTDYNKNNRKDASDSGLSLLLKFKDKTSSYYVDTDQKGQLEDSMGIGKLTIGIANHPYMTATKGDTTLTVKMDSAHHLNFGVRRSSGIYGRLYFDANSNCKYDKNEPSYQGYKVYTDSNKYVGISDHEGIYYIKAPAGTYNLTCDYKPYEFMVSCPSSKSIKVTINGDSACLNNDFGISKNMNYTDLSTGISIGRLRRGNVASVTFYCINNGPTTRKNIKLYSPVNSKFDLTYNSALFASAGSTAVINIDSILPYKSFQIKLDFFVSSTGFAANDKICFNLKTDSSSTAQDSLTTNNSTQECRIVDAPYDPNEKLVAIDSAKTTLDKTISYTIRFQNLGTDTAVRVVVKDSIDMRFLDPSKFQMNWSDAPCEPVIANNVLYFIFNNINLPHFAKSGEKSIAGFNFTLGLKSNVPTETSFSNKASIYFDFENPVITKAAITTINSPIAITKIQKQNSCKNETNKVYFKSKISFQSNNNLILELSDINGKFNTPIALKTIATTSENDSISFSLPPSLLVGTYQLRIRSTNPAAISIPSTGNIAINALALPVNSLVNNLINNKGCENDTLKLSFTNTSYQYKVIRNNIALNNFSSINQYNYLMVKNDSFKFIALDITKGCKDTFSLRPSILQLPVITAAILNRKKEYCSNEKIDLKASGGKIYSYFKGATNLSGNTTVSTYTTVLDIPLAYKILGTDSNGCRNFSDTLNVFVKPSPLATLTSIPAILCFGDSANLVYGNAVSYDLYKNNTLILSKTGINNYKIKNLTDGDKFKAVAFAANGCFTESKELTIVVNPVPSEPILIANNNDLSVVFVGTIKWYRNNILLTNNTGTFVNAPGGIYKVIVTNIEGCSRTSNTVIHRNSALHQSVLEAINIYPNPVNNELTIENPSGISMSYNLYDLNGKNVLKSTEDKELTILKTDHLSSGLYLLKLEFSNGESQLVKINIVH